VLKSANPKPGLGVRAILPANFNGLADAMALVAALDNRPKGCKRSEPRRAFSFGAALARWFLFGICAAAAAQGPDVVPVTPEALRDGLLLDRGWRFHAGDPPNAAEPALDDADWTPLTSWPGSLDNPPDLARAGLGWSRLHLAVDPALRGQPVGVNLNQLGGAEVYFNGRLWRRFGQPAAEPDKERPVRVLKPLVLTLGDQPVQTLAVRFSNHLPSAYFDHWTFQGFEMSLAEVGQLMEAHLSLRIGRERTAGQAMMLTGLYCAFALIHFFMFWFDRKVASNLYFGAISLFGAILVFSQRQIWLTTDLTAFYYARQVWNCMQVAAAVFLPLFTHQLFFGRIPRYAAWGVPALTAAAIGWGLLFRFDGLIVRLALTAVLAETIVVTLRAMHQNRPGARLVGISLLVLSGLIVSAMFNLAPQSLAQSLGFRLGTPHFGAVLLAALMSVWLSRQFALTNFRLAEQLDEVQKLSAELLAREREAKEREIQRRLLEADNLRKTKELEDARAFQLSMLPKKLPQPPGLRLAASMDTAAEVGGDYYDVQAHAGGGLTLALGDAAGHGAKAGVLVAAIKSLFAALARVPDIPGIFVEMNRSLKQMNLRNMFMALTLVKVDGRRLTISAAGMPPLLLYRAATGAVEEIFIKGLPLGGVAGFPYREERIEIHPGDTLLMMSDGLPELFNADSEMFGAARCKAVFQREAAGAPEAILEALRREADAWRGEREQDDDMTFLVAQWSTA